MEFGGKGERREDRVPYYRCLAPEAEQCYLIGLNKKDQVASTKVSIPILHGQAEGRET
jgi:hypothetical protein